MDKCRSCGADIIWGRARKTKKWIPLDGIRVSRGTRFLVDNDGVAHTITDGMGHPSHFATCPNAKEHRKDDSQGELGL
jgi:hypothetical protein